MKKRVFLIAALLSLAASPALAAGKTVTLYLDGALVEQQASARKGVVELVLPAGMQKDSLRVRPVGATRIQRVELIPRTPAKGVERQLAALTERQALLQDRLRALETREEIFTAAAKSQSGKAPRKTKANPDPLTNIRQGTDFALAQLEGVYTARRRAERELKGIGAQLADLRRKENVGGSLARIRVSDGQTVSVRYLVLELSWTPRYDLRSGPDGALDLELHAQLPLLDQGTAASVVVASLADGATATPLPVRDPLAPIRSYRLAALQEHFIAGARSTWTLSLRNTTGVRLPAGEAACFRQGEYLGQAPFAGVAQDQSIEIGCGR